MTFNPNTEWAKGLVNLNQTAGERKAKYQLALSLGASPSHAQRMRDWRWAKIERRFGTASK